MLRFLGVLDGILRVGWEGSRTLLSGGGMLSGKAMQRAIKARYEQPSPEHSHAEARCQQGQQAWFCLVSGIERGRG